MSATIASDTVSLSKQETVIHTEVEFVKCECCRLTEECTIAYIERIRSRYCRRWICGLCAEAVEDEIFRSEQLITIEEALNRHMNFCIKFASSPPPNPTGLLISAMKLLLKRSLDSPRVLRSASTPPSPISEKSSALPLTRSESCFPTMSG